jgi:hypothetical protein
MFGRGFGCGFGHENHACESSDRRCAYPSSIGATKTSICADPSCTAKKLEKKALATSLFRHLDLGCCCRRSEGGDLCVSSTLRMRTRHQESHPRATFRKLHTLRKTESCQNLGRFGVVKIRRRTDSARNKAERLWHCREGLEGDCRIAAAVGMCKNGSALRRCCERACSCVVIGLCEVDERFARNNKREKQ